eukprot:3262061-Amphidinium_carterae.1
MRPVQPLCKPHRRHELDSIVAVHSFHTTFHPLPQTVQLLRPDLGDIVHAPLPQLHGAALGFGKLGLRACVDHRIMTGMSWVGNNVAAIRLCSIGTVVDTRPLLNVSLAQPVPLTRRERWW